MVEKYLSRTDSITAPARRGFAVSPSDATDLAAETRALYVGGSGDLALTLSGGDDVTLFAVPSGSLLPLRARRIRATGTTATLIVGLH